MLDPNIQTPLYMQLADYFRTNIETGKWKPGDQFPPEIELAETYNVSRITIRKAISELEEAGLLVRRQGKGTFITKPKIERELVNVSSFTDRMQARGMRAGSKSLGVKISPADYGMAQRLRIAEGADVVELRRVRLIDEEPVSLETSFLPAERCLGIELEDLADQSLYSVLDNKYSIRPAFSNKNLELAYASSAESKLLEVVRGAPLFLMTALVYSDDHQVMEYVKILLRGDRFRFQL